MTTTSEPRGFRAEIKFGERWLVCVRAPRDLFDRGGPIEDENEGLVLAQAKAFVSGKSPDARVRIVNPRGEVRSVWRRGSGGRPVLCTAEDGR
jgi:hypothetical protein